MRLIEWGSVAPIMPALPGQPWRALFPALAQACVVAAAPDLAVEPHGLGARRVYAAVGATHHGFDGLAARAARGGARRLAGAVPLVGGAGRGDAGDHHDRQDDDDPD